MPSPLGFFVAHFCRWLPHRAPTGLFKIGNPGPDSPVLVTANFSLTVRRLRRAVTGQNLWLLVANSEGINVWCAADGGIFTEQRVIDAVKVTGLAEKVTHHELILPALSAPGMDLKKIRDETGFHADFGPVRADDIPAYLAAGKTKTDPMKRFRFDLKHRLDMFLSMNFPIWAAIAIVIALINPRLLPGVTALFWAAVAILYLGVNIIPGKTGWGQAMFAATTCAALGAAADFVRFHDPFLHAGWLAAIYGLFIAVGFDLAGIATGRKSDAELFMHRLGFKSFGSLFKEKDLGDLTLDADACIACETCREICPRDVFDEPVDGTIVLARPDLCFACGACVKQCGQNALRVQA